MSLAAAVLVLAPMVTVGGMAAATYGRMGIHRDGGRYVGSPVAWTGYYGGMVAVVLSLVAVCMALTKLVLM